MDPIPIKEEDCNGEPLESQTMRLYKFRTLESFEYTADILLNKRFYMARFCELNDPMEGLFAARQITEEFRQKIEKAQKKYRVCSFFRCWRNPLYWAHYADEFKGICIEVEIEYRGGGIWHPVDYQEPRQPVDSGNAQLVRLFAANLLAWKPKEWAYEGEMRAVNNRRYLCCNRQIKLLRVLCGVRTPRRMQRLIRQIAPSSVWTTKISDENKIEVGEEVR